ncbi:MAG: hypothetical protein KAI91_00485 [Candidatus Omnitrophica bacterium]|nr:hypothetical protein [Candidatus Omnitrophota bacterium]MCK5392785.1 hypothetical protein [Candidatus Omnitrophota bacterium]
MKICNTATSKLEAIFVNSTLSGENKFYPGRVKFKNIGAYAPIVLPIF